MTSQWRKNLTTLITREINVVNYMYDYVPFSPHFGGERYFSESIVRFYTLYLMANTFFILRRNACLWRPIEMPTEKKVERTGRKMGTLKY